MYLKTFFIYTVQLSNEPSSLSFVCLVRAANKGLRGCVGLYVLHGCLPYPITDKKKCISHWYPGSGAVLDCIDS